MRLMEICFKTKRSKVRIRLISSMYRNLVVLMATHSTIYCGLIRLKFHEESEPDTIRNLQQNQLDFEAFKVGRSST